MELVTTVITPVVESLMGVVKRHLSFCFYSTNNVTDMRARIQQLNDTARDMKTRKERNDANNLVVPHHIPDWLAEVETICEEAGNVPTGGIGCFNMKTRYKAGKKSSDIIKKIGDLEDEQSRITWSDEQRPLGRVLSTLPSTSEPVVVSAANEDDDDGTQTGLKSRDLIFKEAMKSLDPNNKIQKIALCGMGGVGKTTMMDQLKKVAEDKKMFDWIVKVVIGESANLIAIQQTVAEYIGEPLTETQKDTRAERLRKRFVGMSEDGKKNILVILDDLWEVVDLKDIGLANPLPKGFKLLLTSREENVCTRMDVETSCIFKIAVLEEPEAKKLFWEIAGRVSDGDIDHDICNIGEDIAIRCDGLPIAIKTIASTLKDNNIKDAWKDALFRLQNKKFPILGEIFKISYENLKDDDEKATFLLSGLFPDDYDIPTEELMRYGWGLKLFQDVNSITTARHRVNTCVNNLIRSNLLIKSDDEGCVKMHDLVRDFVLTNFSNVKQASLVNSDDISEQLTKESYERILLKCTGMRELSADLNHPNLALLKLLDGDNLDTFPEDFYDRMEKLEVVAYDKIRQPLLPQYSTNLRTLCLSSCKPVGDISFIGDLINLEVLSFAFCGISKLPSAVGNLKKLKLLDLTDCVDLCIDDGVFHKLEKLRELYMRACEGKPIRFTEDSCEGLKMLSSKLIALDVEFFGRIIQPKNLSFEKLERFRIAIGCQFEDIENLVHKYVAYKSTWKPVAYKNTLKLVVSCKELLECKIIELFEKTEKLGLSVNEMSSLEEISLHPSQHSFCNLRDLRVHKCADLTSIFTVNVASSLTKLEKLKVSYCPVLVNIFPCNSMRLVSHLTVINGEKQQPLSLFHNLTYIYLGNCESIKYLFSPLLATHLSNLKKVMIQCCDGMEEIVSNRDDNEDEQMTAPTTTTLFPHLEELYLEHLPSLKHVGGGGVAKGTNNDINDQLKYSQEPVVCWSLCQYSRDITLVNCPAISQLIPSHVAGQFLMVERLYINYCNGMKEVFTTTDINNSGGLSSNFKERSGGTDTALAIPRLTSITAHNLSNLKTMGIWCCDSLEHIFTFSTLESLTKLEHISIGWCKAMKVMVREENGKQTAASKAVVFPRLKSIILAYLPNLEGFFLGMTEFKWPLLEHVEIMRCPKLMAFTSSKSTAPKLKYIGSIFSNYSPEWHNFYVKTNSPQTPSLSLHNRPLSLDDTIEVNLENNSLLQEIFASNELLQLQNLERIHVKRYECVKTVFEVESEVTDSELNSKLQTVVKFPKLREVDLEALHWLKYIWKSNIQGMKLEFPNLTRLSIHNCYRLKYVFTSSMVGSLMQLQDLHITKCEKMKVIVKDEEDEENTEEECDGDGKVSEIIVFPCLKSLKLENLVQNFKGFYLGKDLDFSLPSLNTLVIKECPKLEIFTKGCVVTPELKVIETNLGLIDVGEQDINSFIITKKQEPLSFFHNLTTITLRQCKSIKYLFSPLMATHLSNLEKLRIGECDGMEEVVSNRDDNEDEQMTAPTTTTLFPHLEELTVYAMPSLKHVGGGGVAKGTNNDINDQLKYSQVPVVCWSLCQYSRKITVWNCPAMSQLIPSYVAGQILMVENLNIADCIVMKEVFATTYINNSGGLSSNFEDRSGGTNTALAIPRLTSIIAHKLSNLRTMNIWNCNSLEHIFTFSTLESLTKLEKISIRSCKAMKVIVREENAEPTVASKAIVFPRLKSIGLGNLPNLEGFFLGMSEFKWPLLDDVRIVRCPKLMAFTSSKSTAPKLKYIHTIFGTYSPECCNFYVTANSPRTPSLSLENEPLSLHDTIEVNVENHDEIEEIFASNELLQLPNLEKIHVKRCGWVKTVFEVESEVIDTELNSKLQTVVKFPKLREVDLEELRYLEYIWKSNIHGMKLEFLNLTRLSIHNCYRLKYVFTSSMAGSLMQLHDLHITNCNDMEVIVKDEEDEENTEEECDGDGKVSEIIVFPCLKSLKLDNLVRNFKGFYLGKEVNVSLPSLDTLVIKRCPKLKVFTKGLVIAPELKVIETNLGLIDVGEQDINSFIITKSQEGLHL